MSNVRKFREAQDRVNQRFTKNVEALYNRFDEDTSKLLKERFMNAERLMARKEEARLRKEQLNQEYVTATQGVLNEQTLDFLVKHSMISAPTMTSLFAGFELARASEADRLEQNMTRESAFIDEETAAQQELTQAQNEMIESQIGLGSDIFSNRTRDQRAIAEDEGQADVKDIQRGNTLEDAERKRGEELADAKRKRKHDKELADIRESGSAPTSLQDRLSEWAKYRKEGGQLAEGEAPTTETLGEQPQAATPQTQDVVEPEVSTPAVQVSLTNLEREVINDLRSSTNDGQFTPVNNMEDLNDEELDQIREARRRLSIVVPMLTQEERNVVQSNVDPDDSFSPNAMGDLNDEQLDLVLQMRMQMRDREDQNFNRDSQGVDTQSFSRQKLRDVLSELQGVSDTQNDEELEPTDTTAMQENQQ